MILNLLLTSLLAIRLLYMRRQLQVSMGASSGKAYISVVAMVIESALPFGILSIIFLVLFGRQDPTQNLFIPLLVQVEVGPIPPLESHLECANPLNAIVVHFSYANYSTCHPGSGLVGNYGPRAISVHSRICCWSTIVDISRL